MIYSWHPGQLTNLRTLRPDNDAAKISQAQVLCKCFFLPYCACMDKQKLLYSKRETAQTLSLSLRTVDNLIARNELQIKRVGKRVLVLGRSLARFARYKSEIPEE